jgi:hypothetical protein
MLPCRQWQTTRYEGRGRQDKVRRLRQGGKKEQASKGSKERQARASKQVSRVEKQRDSHTADTGTCIFIPT